MLKENLKKILINIAIVLLIFLTDRISKIYILKVAELENTVDIYINSYLNFYLIWNKGIAFGLLSYNENYIYNMVTLAITIIVIAILIMLIKAEGFRKYSLITGLFRKS